MAIIDYFPAQLALDESGTTIIRDAAATVYALSDEALTTPLALTDLQGVPMPTLTASNTGIYPAFRTVGEAYQVVAVSGSLRTPMTSLYGSLLEVVPDPTQITEAVAATLLAQQEAEAAADAVPGMVTPLVEQALESSEPLRAAVTDRVNAEVLGRKLVESLIRFPEEAAGGFVGENGQATDLLVNAAGDVLSSVIVRWAQRLQLEGGLTGGVKSLWYGGGFAGENGRATELQVDDLGNVPAEVLARWAQRMPLVYPPASEHTFMSGPDILTLGDSLTASGNIASRLAALTGRTVRNMGVGGETSTTIGARLGATPWLVSPVDMIIPASGSVDVTFASSHPDGGATWPLLQGTGVREGDTLLWGTVAGVRVRFSIRVKDAAVPYPTHGAGDVYQLTRATPGAAVTLKRAEPFLPEHGRARSGDIIVAWLGQNGPSDDVTFATFEAIDKWVTKAGARLLFMTKPTGDNTGWTDFEKRVLNRWGRRYLNVRRFLIDDALPLMGLTASSTDLADIAAGRVPTQLRTDAVHHTAAAQQAIAEWLVYPRLIELDRI